MSTQKRKRSRFEGVIPRRRTATLVGLALPLVAVSFLLLFLAVSPSRASDLTFDTVYGFGDPVGNTTSIAMGDLNGDGMLDLVVGDYWQPNVVYLNDGSGAFSSGSPFGCPDTTSSLAVGDLNGDGALDLVVGNDWSPSLIYLNDGAGAFTANPLGDSEHISITLSVAVGDLNGDGALDIVAGNSGYQNLVYLNDGTGVFSAYSLDSSGYTSDTTSVALGDLNGDGALDVVVGNDWQQNLIYLNDGAGVFTASPLGDSGFLSPTLSVAVGDLNADGALDVVAGNAKRQSLVYLNDGTGSFSLGGAFGGSDQVNSVALADLNGDGSLDLVAGINGDRNLVYLNDGVGGFSSGSPFGGLDWTRSVAVGDVDSDGALDLVVGNDFQQDVVYLSDGSAVFSPGVPFGDWSWTQSVAVGDLDGDGALDLVAGNYWQPNQVYLNEAGDRGKTLGAFSTSPLGDAGYISNTESVAIGDLDGDGALDLVVGNYKYRNLVYLNDGAGAFSSGSPFGGPDATYSVALGDLDGDGALDVVVGNFLEPNSIYLNDGSGAFSTGVPFGGADRTESVAVGDLDGDGALDLVVGNDDQQNVVYLNDGRGTFSTGIPFGAADWTTSLALGDLDGDGALDLVVGNRGSQNLIYLNDGAGAFSTGIPFGGPAQTFEVALGDLDGDGTLDLIVGNEGSQSLVYLNDGAGAFSTGSPFGGPDATHSVALGDMDGDGTLDLAAGNYGQPNVVYRNRSRRSERLADTPPYLAVNRPVAAGDANFFSTPEILDSRFIPITYTLFDLEGDRVGRVAATYSLDGGGKWSPAALTDTVTTNLETSLPHHYVSRDAFPIPISATSSLVSATLVVPGDGPIADVNVWLNVTHAHDSDLDVSLESPWGQRVELFSAVGGSGADFTGTALDDEAAIAIISGTAPFTDTYRPEGNLSDFDGQMARGTWTLWVTDTVPITGDGALLSWGLDLQAGSGAHVLTWDTFASGVFGRSDNVVFRLEAYPQPIHSDISGTYAYTGSAPGPYQWPYAAAATFPFRVQGTQVRVYSETVAPGNEAAGAIVYRLPGGQSQSAEPMGGPENPFHTDGHGYLQGRGRLEIGDRLVALLPITSTDSYTLYHTSASPTLVGLDAYTVTAPGVQVLAVTSDSPLVLFDLDVSLEWDARADDAFASQLTFDLLRASELLYDWTNGQAALGRVTVYHDRDHWLDAHVRIYSSNRLRPSAVQGGIVSAVVTDPITSTITYVPGQVHMGSVWNRYGDPGGSLGEDWPRALAHELGHYALFLNDNYLGFDEAGLLISVDGCPGAMSDSYREDYPYDEFHPADGWLPACERTLSHQATGRSDWETIAAFYPWFEGAITNTGPDGLPLAVTQIHWVTPVTSPTTLEDPTFYLSAGGHRVQLGTGARAFLFRGGWATDLGCPTVDRVLARGARPGDRLCVYEPAAGRLGCETISAGDEQLELATVSGWQPDVVVSPITSRTIGITVTGVPTGQPLWARLFPVTHPASEPISLTETVGVYAGVLGADEPALEGYVHVWVEDSVPLQEIVTDYALGGDPGHVRGHGGHVRGHGAPAISADGQVILHEKDIEFEEDEFVALQAATHIPSPLPWATVVGHGYRLVSSAGAPDLRGASISFSYLGREAPSGEEAWLRVYFWDGEAWRKLPTTLDTYHNMASAEVQGEGLYVLMSSLEIPLRFPGWNLFAYPVEGSRGVTEGLLSIGGYYTTVYGYEGAGMDPWKVYDVGAPAWVNDLHELEFGRGYWINVSDVLTLYLKGGTVNVAQGSSDGFPYPPATYYGPVAAGDGLVPAAGMTVTAWVSGTLCGQSVLTDVAGYGVAYVVDVMAEDWGAHAGCGALGREVMFRVNGRDMASSAIWDNNRLWELTLRPPSRVYVPLIVRGTN